MIKHHPSESLLAQYCSAQLPASLSVAVSIHVDMCPVCQAKVAKLEAELKTFEEKLIQIEDTSSNMRDDFNTALNTLLIDRGIMY